MKGYSEHYTFTETLLVSKYLKNEMGLDGRSLYEGHETDISFEETQEISAYINEKAYRTISSKSSELADLAILCVYTVLGKNSKSFLWNVFGQEVVDTIKKKHK